MIDVIDVLPNWSIGFWKLDLLMAIPLAITGGWYAIGTGRLLLAMPRPCLPKWEIGAFAAGWLTLVIALLSPIATVSETLLSVHMTQHQLLMLVAAPLIVLGRPLVPMLWALPASSRLRMKGAMGLTPAIGWVTSPFVAFAFHAIALWVWHLPQLYEAAVLDDRVHAVQHVCFTVTACLFWWGLLRGRYGRLGYGAAVFYVFATALHSGALGSLMTLSSRPWYALYVSRASHGSDPLTDQQQAGLIMWIVGGVMLTIFGLALFVAWLGEAERRRRLAG